MRLVTSMMTSKEMMESDIKKAVAIFEQMYNCKISYSKFKYDDRKFYETDIDLVDIVFSKSTLSAEIKKLISLYEQIMEELSMDIDFITANDDTETEIMKYENDINDVKNFGLFVTKRTISNLEPYYSSLECNAYVNLTYVSFGVYE